MASKLKITSSQLIAREVVLELSEASFTPRHVAHVPGVMNVLAGALSRLDDPRSHYEVPAQLLGVPRASPSRRNAAFYTTLVD